MTNSCLEFYLFITSFRIIVKKEQLKMIIMRLFLLDLMGFSQVFGVTIL